MIIIYRKLDWIKKIKEKMFSRVLRPFWHGVPQSGTKTAETSESRAGEARMSENIFLLLNFLVSIILTQTKNHLSVVFGFSGPEYLYNFKPWDFNPTKIYYLNY